MHDRIELIEHSFPWCERTEWWWPKDDIKLRAVIDDVNDVEGLVDRHCKNRRMVFQAGAACGIFPYRLASLFDSVVTMEPLQDNFQCAWRNFKDIDKMRFFNGAVGSGEEKQGMSMKQHPREQNNAGSFQLDYTPGDVIMFTIDEIVANTDHCDLIMLDLEGYELHAVQGGKRIIDRDRPVIVVEDKGLSQKFGHGKNVVIEYLESQHGYSVAEKIKRDVVMIP